MQGTETPAEIEGDAALMARIEEIRGRCAALAGLTDTWQNATKNARIHPSLPLCRRRKAYHTFDGKDVDAGDIDLVSRLLFMQMMHKTHPVTGTVCMGTAARVPGQHCASGAE